MLERYVVMGCFREAQAPRPPTCRAAWTLGPVQRVGQNYQSPFTFPEQPAIPARRRFLGKSYSYPLKT